MGKSYHFAAEVAEAKNFVDLQELFHNNNWTDGLPIVPPSPEPVGELLDWASLPAEHIVGIEPVRERAVTAEQLAINAVMAGCLAKHFPVVVAAFIAMLQDPFVLHGATSSTGGCAILALINGPVLEDLNIDATFNALGATDRATTTIGRAIRLSLQNILDVRPGEADRSTLGHPGKLSFCMGEDEARTSWASVAEERGLPPNISAVTVMAAGSPRQIMNEWTTDPEEILDTYIAEIRASMLHYSIYSGNWAIIIPPQLREHFEAAEWTKKQIREYVYNNARVLRKEWETCGKVAVVGEDGEREYLALRSPDDLIVIAAGGPAGGFGAVIAPWFGKTSQAVTVAIGACVDCKV